MACGCGGSKKLAGERLAARRAAKIASSGSRVGGVSSPETFWNGPPKRPTPK